ncbi:NifB/NifX family molybdenum-iron cluster-binding protein [Azospirillum sp. TSO22-1]|uniref:NifB/NifX family molybdenum-iron cluster-binding protein n=1 Tax=Azospirillum sp. TSO22-1 TaxID=716789 RepID=UPI000D65B12D|nr:NifB/NifX family molybdenum-iron cluster-binding protein [Azospirillum sp. TSO22-1]
MPIDTGNTTAPAGAEERFRVAVGGTEGGLIDQHFGQAEEFLIYGVDTASARLLERRRIDAHAEDGEDRRATIIRMLKDCRTLLVAKVGAAPRQMLAEAGIEASDRYAGKPVDAALAELAATA